MRHNTTFVGESHESAMPTGVPDARTAALCGTVNAFGAPAVPAHSFNDNQVSPVGAKLQCEAIRSPKTLS